MRDQTFTNPQADQASSRLFQLPAEIRQKVLRQLLVHDTAIGTLNSITKDWPADEKAWKVFGEYCSLSAQFLRTCQKSHDESINILYQENVLSIEVEGVSSGEFRESRCSMLDVSIPLPNFSHGDMCPSLDMDAYAKRLLKSRVTTERHVRAIHQSRRMLAIWPVLVKFQRYEVNVEDGDYKAVFMACRMLRYMLKDKTATFKISYEETEDAEDGEDEEERDAEVFLNCFKILHCSSREFVFDSQTQTGLLLSKVHLNCFRDPGPVKDTYGRWYNLKEDVRRRLDGRNGYSLQQKYGSDLVRLRDVSMQYDQDLYYKIEQQLLQGLSESIERWEKTEIEKVQEMREGVEEIISKYRSLEAE